MLLGKFSKSRGGFKENINNLGKALLFYKVKHKVQPPHNAPIIFVQPLTAYPNSFIKCYDIVTDWVTCDCYVSVCSEIVVQLR